MFAASLSLTRTSVAALLAEADDDDDSPAATAAASSTAPPPDMGGLDVDAALFAPLGALLARCKAAKTLSRRMIRRLEDLAQEGAAVRPHVVPQMKALSNCIAELVNFGITVRLLHGL